MLARLRRVGGDLDPAELAAPADLDLRLDRARVADPVGGGDRLVDRARRLARRHRDAVAREQLLSLVLEEIHRRGADSIRRS